MPRSMPSSSHNDKQELHDLKWAITINTLKAFSSKNQRIIERILGKGKDNPNIDRIIGDAGSRN